MIKIVVIPSQHTQNSEVLFMSEHVMDFLEEKKKNVFVQLLINPWKIQ